jgi:hypothetical protein
MPKLPRCQYCRNTLSHGQDKCKECDQPVRPAILRPSQNPSSEHPKDEEDSEYELSSSDNEGASEGQGVGMIYTNTRETAIVLESSPTPAPQAPPAQAKQPQQRRTMSSDSSYFPPLEELIAESFKAKRRTKREPSPEAAAEPNFESSPEPKEYDPFDYIPRPGNPLPSLPAGSPSSSASAPRHEKRAPLPYAMTVSGEAMAAAAKDAKKKKLRPNAGSKPLSLRKDDPPLPGFQERESVYLLQVEFKGYYATTNDRDMAYPFLTPLEYRVFGKLICPFFYFARYITYSYLAWTIIYVSPQAPLDLVKYSDPVQAFIFGHLLPQVPPRYQGFYKGADKDIVLKTGEYKKDFSNHYDKINKFSSRDLAAMPPGQILTVRDILPYLVQHSDEKVGKYQAHLIVQTENPMRTAQALRDESQILAAARETSKPTRGRKKANPTLPTSSPAPSRPHFLPSSPASASPSSPKQPPQSVGEKKKQQPIVKTEKQPRNFSKGISHSEIPSSVCHCFDIPG